MIHKEIKALCDETEAVGPRGIGASDVVTLVAACRQLMEENAQLHSANVSGFNACYEAREEIERLKRTITLLKAK